MLVQKRDGTKEPLDLTKLQKVVAWATEGIKDVSDSEIQLKSKIQFYDKIKTSDIQETLVQAAHNLITEDTPDYQYVAGRLINWDLRKKVWPTPVTPPRLFDHVKRIANLGFYTKELLDWYTEDEFDQMDRFIDHNKDLNHTYASMDQFRAKYAVQNRSTKEIYETPQLAFVLIAATTFHNYKKDRMKWVKEFYEALSDFDVGLPSPIMAGLRTNEKQFSSCVLIECGDSLESIISTAGSIVRYVSRKAGIGIGAGAIRAQGSRIRRGDTTHTGTTSFLKFFDAAINSCSQGGIRKGSGTINFVGWHSEFRNQVVLKNNKGTKDNRITGMDYCIQLNGLMYQRYLDKGNITLFSPSDVPGLYEAFFSDQAKFKELYEKAERNPKIKKEVIPAAEYFKILINERKDTGRIYIMNVDNVNNHGAFDPSKAPVRMTNLCVEVNLPTKPLDSLDDPEGEIALCVLASVNFGRIKKPSDFERPCEILVRALDEIISYQEYPIPAARNATMNRRSIGIGPNDIAHWLALNNIQYDNITRDQLNFIDEYVEAWSYYLIKASVDLAKEFGPCPKWKETRYGSGLVPLDTSKAGVDDIVERTERLDWNWLRKELIQNGIRNSTLMAGMPNETNSTFSNLTNGFESPKALVSIKGSKNTKFKIAVPDLKKLKNKYDLLWNWKSCKGYLKISCVFQKWMDQAISVNTTYDPKNYEDQEIPESEMLEDILLFYRWGGKDLYYCTVNDGAGEQEEQPAEKPVTQESTEEAECESCKL